MGESSRFSRFSANAAEACTRFQQFSIIVGQPNSLHSFLLALFSGSSKEILISAFSPSEIIVEFWRYRATATAVAAPTKKGRVGEVRYIT